MIHFITRGEFEIDDFKPIGESQHRECGKTSSTESKIHTNELWGYFHYSKRI